MRIILSCLTAALILAACSPSLTLTRFQAGFLGTFDTYIDVMLYAGSRQEFSEHFTFVRETFEHYHALFDIYNEHSGLNNLRTVNDNAGIAPVAVGQEIVDLLSISQQAYYDTGGALNIALGPVLSIWHDYRLRGLEDPDNTMIPPYSALRAAYELSIMSDVIIDGQAGTVFLANAGMSLDVGATAKGFTVGRVAEMLRERGVTSAIISAGGDVVTIGESPVNGGRPWNVGVRNPLDRRVIDSVLVRDMAAATSGGDQRAFVVDGVAYNHIIDPATLMPATGFAAVSVIHEDMMTAEILSTALFILPLNEGLRLAEDFGAAAIWVLHDGSVEFNRLYAEISSNFGD